MQAASSSVTTSSQWVWEEYKCNASAKWSNVMYVYINVNVGVLAC